MRPQDIMDMIKESSESIKFISGLDDCYVTTMVIGTNKKQYLVRVNYGVEQGGYKSELRTINKETYMVDEVSETDELFIPYFVCPKCGNTHLRVVIGSAVVRGDVGSVHVDGELKYYEEEIVYGVGCESDKYECNSCGKLIATGGQESLYVAVNEYAEMVDEYDKFIPSDDDFWDAQVAFIDKENEDNVGVRGYSFKCPKCSGDTVLLHFEEIYQIKINPQGEEGLVGRSVDVVDVPSNEDIKMRCTKCNRIVKKGEIRWNS